MDYEFKLPDIGEGLVEGEIVKWFVKVGDTVAENAPLAAVLTDKAEVEVPSPKSGTIVKLFGKPGEKIKVHAPLAVIAVGGNGTTTPAPAVVQKTDKISAKTAPAPAKTSPAIAGGFVFNLPDIGEGLVEGELVKWMVKEGEKVSENQTLAAVLTDKAEVEVPSPKTGTIAKLHAKPGEKVKVHSPLVTFSGVSGAAPAAVAVERSVAAAAPVARSASGGRSLATPMVRKMAKDMGVDIESITGTGPQGRVLEADLRAPKRAGEFIRDIKGSDNATKAVNELARQLGVEISNLVGTGPGGRISEADVRAVAPAKPTAASAAPAAASSASGYPPVAIARKPGDSTAPFSGIRRKIAEKMQQSRRTVAHVTHMDECDMTAVMELRSSLKKEAEKRKVKLTFLPFIVRALTKALAEFPMFNSSLDEVAGEIVVKARKNVGIAVAAPQGLVVPNIKDAEGKDIWSLAVEIAAVAEKVRSGKIDVPSLQDGTITITNIGPIGGLYATPIVNHPEVAILGLMKMRPTPVVREGKVVVREVMNLVLSFDHRIVDGADAANFTNTIIKHLENPRTLI